MGQFEILMGLFTAENVRGRVYAEILCETSFYFCSLR